MGVEKTVGDLMGPCFFAVLMGTSRVFYAKISAKINLLKYMCFCGVLCIFSYMLAAFSPIPVLSLIGCGICGFSVGAMWPSTYSAAAGALPRGGTAMFGGLKQGLPFSAIFPAVLIVAAVITMRITGKRSR